MFNDLLTPTHLLFLLALALLIFGPRRLPEIGSALGKGLHDFRQAVNRVDSNEPRSPQGLNPPSDSVPRG